jgi:hypothetical protein
VDAAKELGFALRNVRLVAVLLDVAVAAAPRAVMESVAVHLTRRSFLKRSALVAAAPLAVMELAAVDLTKLRAEKEMSCRPGLKSTKEFHYRSFNAETL